RSAELGLGRRQETRDDVLEGHAVVRRARAGVARVAEEDAREEGRERGGIGELMAAREPAHRVLAAGRERAARELAREARAAEQGARGDPRAPALPAEHGRRVE